MEASRTGHSTNLIQSVVKAIDVLECLAAAEEPLSVRQVAESCGFSRPTAYRLLSTLLARNYVQNVSDGHYHVGTRVLSLSKSLLDRLDLPEVVAKADLHQLSQMVRETVHLSILDDTEILYVDKAESSPSVHIYCTVGTRNPLYNTAMGKAILAFLPDERRDALLDRIPLEPHTPSTITDRNELIRHLQTIHKQGYAIDDMENEGGIRCIGAPIFDHVGQAIAAISVSGPAHRLPDARLKEISEPVKRTAMSISVKLGYVPNLHRERKEIQ